MFEMASDTDLNEASQTFSLLRNTAKIGSFDHCALLENIDKCTAWVLSENIGCKLSRLLLFNAEKIALQCGILYFCSNNSSSFNN